MSQCCRSDRRLSLWYFCCRSLIHLCQQHIRIFTRFRWKVKKFSQDKGRISLPCCVNYYLEILYVCLLLFVTSLKISPGCLILYSQIRRVQIDEDRSGVPAASAGEILARCERSICLINIRFFVSVVLFSRSSRSLRGRILVFFLFLLILLLFLFLLSFLTIVSCQPVDF